MWKIISEIKYTLYLTDFAVPYVPVSFAFEHIIHVIMYVLQRNASTLIRIEERLFQRQLQRMFPCRNYTRQKF